MSGESFERISKGMGILSREEKSSTVRDVMAESVLVKGSCALSGEEDFNAGENVRWDGRVGMNCKMVNHD